MIVLYKIKSPGSETELRVASKFKKLETDKVDPKKYSLTITSDGSDISIGLTEFFLTNDAEVVAAWVKGENSPKSAPFMWG